MPQDIRWGRTYEGYCENTDLVSQLGMAHVRGLQNADDKAGLNAVPTQDCATPLFLFGYSLTMRDPSPQQLNCPEP